MLINRHNNCLSMVCLHAYLLKFVQANEEGMSMAPMLQKKLLGFQEGICLFFVFCFWFCFPKVKKPHMWVGWCLCGKCIGPQRYADNCYELCSLWPAWFCLSELISVQVIFLLYLRCMSLFTTWSLFTSFANWASSEKLIF